jgi:Lar family restriction alleviation protein
LPIKAVSIIDVLPCPFCGSKTITIRDGSNFKWIVAECDDCGASCGEVRKLVGMETKLAIEEWNKRFVGTGHARD